jgi:hypothetical protein
MQNLAKWAGRVISALTACLMIADGIINLAWPQLLAPHMAADGWPPARLLPIAVMALTGGLLYAIPRTTILGAILITGFMGGALAVHLRMTMTLIGPEIVAILIGAAAWVGLYLRDPRLRALFLARR